MAKGGGDGNQKKVDGLNVGLTVKPDDVYTPKTMAGFATILFVGSVAVLGISKLATPIARYLFGATDTAAKVEVRPDDVVNVIKTAEEFKNDSRKSWVMKEAFGATSLEGKQRFKEWVNKQEMKEPEAPAEAAS